MLRVLFEIGGLKVNTFGVTYALGYLAWYFVASRLGERWQKIPPRIMAITGIVIFLSGALGAWLFQAAVEILDHGHGLDAIGKTFPGQGGVGVFYGGVVFGMLGVYTFFRIRKLYWWHNTDVIFMALPLGLAIGRLGCFSAGCCFGKACDLPWAVRFPEEASRATGVPAGVPLHPAQLYAVLANLLVFGLLVAVLRWKRFPGQVALCYFIAYGAARFTLEFFRDDPRGFYPFGLSTSQGIAILFILASVAMWPWLSRKEVPDSPFYGSPAGGGGTPKGNRRGKRGKR